MKIAFLLQICSKNVFFKKISGIIFLEILENFQEFQENFLQKFSGRGPFPPFLGVGGGQPRFFFKKASLGLAQGEREQMIGKKKRHVDTEAQPGKRLCQNIKDLYGAGILSAGRTQSLLDDAKASGVDECGFGSSAHSMASNPKPRDVRKRLLKDSQWPELFEAKGPVKVRSGELEETALHFMLPHEVLFQLWQISDANLMLSSSGLDAVSLRILASIKRELRCDDVIPLSFWMDSVPYSWDRDESLQCFTWGMPGIDAKPWKNLRFPFCCLPKAMCSQETADFVMRVWSWSLTALSLGMWPTTFSLESGVVGGLAGKVRLKMGGKPFGFKDSHGASEM